ncbi:MAG: tetratricopeptide repeat protein [Kiritimatiellia bacterium]
MMNLRRLLGVRLAMLFLAFAPYAAAQEEGGPPGGPPKDEFEREKLFALTLVEWGLPDYAQLVKDQLASKFPAQKENLLLIQANIFFKQKKYADVEVLLKELPATNTKAQAIRLRMAAYLMSDGDRAKAGEIIQGFFDQLKGDVPNDPDLREQFVSAAFILADIHRTAGQPAKAVAVLGLIHKAAPAKVILRKADSDRIYAMLDLAATQSGDERNKTLAEVDKVANALQWQSDPYKGHGLVAMAMAKKLRGDKAGAIALIREYSADLTAIDKEMERQKVMIDNPMAAARLFIGKIYEEDGRAEIAAGKKEEARKNLGKALTEYINVFRKYGKDDAGKKAGLLYNDLATYVEKELGIKVKPVSESVPGVKNTTPDTELARMMLNLGDELRKNAKYPEAVVKYLEVLNKYPETPLTAQILYSLLTCYEKTGEDLMIEMVAGYAADRFGDKDDLVAVAHTAASKFIKAGKVEQGTNIIARILVGAPNYKQNCALRYIFAGYLYKNGQRTVAMEEYQKVVEACSGDAVAIKSLNALAMIAYEAKQYDVAATNLTKLVASAPEGVEKAEAKTRLINCLIQLKQMEEALGQLRVLINDLQPGRANSPYYTAESKTRSEGLLQTNTFFLATTLSKLEPGAAGVKDPQAEALKIFDDFIAKNPGNKAMTPVALFAKGRMLITLGKFDEAIQSFEVIAAKFPDSEQGQGAMFAGVKAAIEAGKPDVARQFVQKMLGNRNAYGAREFLIVGTFMIENKMFDEAEKCLQSVVEHKDTAADETLHQRALYGFALCANRQAAANNNDAKRIEASIKSITTLTNKYAKTGLLMDAALLQASSLRLKKDFNGATGALNLVFENAYRLKDKKAEIQANVELAHIQTDEGKAKEAFASMMRIIILGADFKNEKLKPVYRDVILQGLEAGGKLTPSRPKDVRTLTERFLDNYPGDPETGRIQELRKKAILELGGQ